MERTKEKHNPHSQEQTPLRDPALPDHHSALGIADNRRDAALQRQISEMISNSPQVAKTAQYQSMAQNSPHQARQSRITSLIQNSAQPELHRDEDKPEQLKTSPTQTKEHQTDSSVTQKMNNVIQMDNDALIQLLGDAYHVDRNYRSWMNGAQTAHVGWKAHIGANPIDMIDMATQLGARLRALDVPHKFDISSDDNAISKFLTIYPPPEETTWANVIANVEPLLNNYGDVDIESDMQVGNTGRVRMRHGQNTNLSVANAGDLIQPDGTLGAYTQYSGDAIGVDLPLLSAGGTLFFSKTEAAPEALNPGHIFMAVRHNDQIMPDRREIPNPLNEPMPEGVQEYQQPEADQNGGKCCYITTACVHHMGLGDDCKELMTLRNFRDAYLIKKPNGQQLIEFYYQYSPQIVRAIRSREDEEEILKRIYLVVLKCVAAIEKGDDEFAFQTYCQMVINLKSALLPEDDLELPII